MKKSVLLIIMAIVLFLTGSSFAQQDIYDCSSYKNAGDYYRAIEAGKRAIRLYPKNGYAHFCLGDAYYLTGESNLAIKSMKEAEKLSYSERELMLIYNRLGMIYRALSDYDNALIYNNRYLSLAHKLENRTEEATALNNIALIHNAKGEPDKALSYYEEALRLMADEKAKSPTYNNIALIYSNEGDYNKAISYFKKALEISERYGNYHGAAIVMLNLGDTYRSAKDFIKAEEYFTEGLKRILRVGDKRSEANAYKYIGAMYRDKGEVQKAKDYLTKAYNLFEIIGAKDGAKDAITMLNEIKLSEKKHKQEKTNE